MPTRMIWDSLLPWDGRSDVPLAMMVDIVLDCNGVSFAVLAADRYCDLLACGCLSPYFNNPLFTPIQAR
jgi:hypothetical protein